VIRSYKGTRPTLGAGAYVDVSAQVIGDVDLDKEAYRAEAGGAQ
jgi:carbonic anhydrase/acetyltransferase-like protein (isoleucine patch superfamily)